MTADSERVAHANSFRHREGLLIQGLRESAVASLANSPGERITSSIRLFSVHAGDNTSVPHRARDLFAPTSGRHGNEIDVIPATHRAHDLRVGQVRCASNQSDAVIPTAQ